MSRYGQVAYRPDEAEAGRLAWRAGLWLAVDYVRGWGCDNDRPTWMLYDRAGRRLLLTYWPDEECWRTPGGETDEGDWADALRAAKRLKADPAGLALAPYAMGEVR